MTILVAIVLFLLIVTNFGLEVDETADGRPSMAFLNPNRGERNWVGQTTERAYFGLLFCSTIPGSLLFFFFLILIIFVT